MKKIIIYQALTRLFGNKNNTNKPHGTLSENGCGKFNDFTTDALNAIKELNTTHIWFTGIIDHATQTPYPEQDINASPSEIVKGKAGSPYAIRNYYDVSPDLATNPSQRMQEFEALTQRVHDAGLKVIIDFVPNHVSRDYKKNCNPEGILCLGAHDNQSESFSPKNNFYYLPGQPLRLPNTTTPVQRGVFYEFPAKVTGNDCFSAQPSINDWYETIKLNYGIDYQNGHTKHFNPTPDTWYKMLEILLFWSDKNVDGFRCDMAEMVPVEFWEWCIPQIKANRPNIIFIAEVYKPELYRAYIHQGKFDYLYDKVGLYDTLRGVIQGHQSASDITKAWQAVDDIKHYMLNFLENHDEQRIASSFFANNPLAALPALVVSTCINNNPYMHYFAQDIGEKADDQEGFSGKDGRTTIFDYWGVIDHQKWMNGGLFDGALLSPDKKNLRALYIKILSLASNTPSLLEGNFYDLQWANLSNSNYNDNNVFSFLRYDDKTLMIFICNFASHEEHVTLHIPEDARELTGLNKMPKLIGQQGSVFNDWTNLNIDRAVFSDNTHTIAAYDTLFYRFEKTL